MHVVYSFVVFSASPFILIMDQMYRKSSLPHSVYNMTHCYYIINFCVSNVLNKSAQ